MSAALRVGVIVVVTVLVATMTSTSALACAVCGNAKAPNDWAFGVMTIVLSLLPLLLLGGVVFFIVRTLRKSKKTAESISTPD